MHVNAHRTVRRIQDQVLMLLQVPTTCSWPECTWAWMLLLLRVPGARREGRELTCAPLCRAAACSTASAPAASSSWSDGDGAERSNTEQGGKGKFTKGFIEILLLLLIYWRALVAASIFAELRSSRSPLRSVPGPSGTPAARGRRKKVSFLTLTLKFQD